MGVFDNYKEINGKIVDNTWVEWCHWAVPNLDNWVRLFIRNLLAVFYHCLKCTSIDGCYFVSWNIPIKEDVEKGLLHEKCDCNLKNIPFADVMHKSHADCSKDKFTNYIFSNNSKGKKELFESWGYTVSDAEYLVDTFCKQAKENYTQGKYKLKNLDKYGQRLAIPITLKQNITFYSGWMLCTEGKLKNTTPFGGVIK